MLSAVAPSLQLGWPATRILHMYAVEPGSAGADVNKPPGTGSTQPPQQMHVLQDWPTFHTGSSLRHRPRNESPLSPPS